jgi:tetratricopeptide (TPR) repeat protein
MFRTVELSPSMTNRVVRTMSESGIDAPAILETLPASPYVLIALKEAYLSAGAGLAFLAALERKLADFPLELLTTYGDVAETLGQSHRLQERLGALGPLADHHAEAERLYQTGRAELLEGSLERAYASGRSAAMLWPEDPRYCEFHGASARMSGRRVEANGIYKACLSSVASLTGAAPWRARFYRGIGEVAEDSGAIEVAIDNYQRALRNDPSERTAQARMTALGVRPKHGPVTTR